MGVQQWNVPYPTLAYSSDLHKIVSIFMATKTLVTAGTDFIDLKEEYEMQGLLEKYDGDVDDTVKKLVTLKFLDSKIGIRCLAKEIAGITITRSKYMKSIAALVKKLFEMSSNFKTVLLRKLFHVTTKNIERISNCRLLLELSIINAINIDDILSGLESFPSKYENQYFLCLVCFLEPIQNHDVMYLNNLLEKVSEFKFLSPASQTFFNEYIKPRCSGSKRLEKPAKRWGEVTQILRDGYPHKSLEYYIKYDMEDEFADYVKNNGVDLNSSIKVTLFESFDLTEFQPRIAQAAAYYGAENIFRFLLTKRTYVRLPDNAGHILTHFVTASGNPFILQWCKDHELDFTGTLIYAAIFRRENVFNFIKEDDKSDQGEVLCAAAANNFISAAEWLLKDGTDINYKNKEDSQTPFHQAAQAGHPNLVRLFVSQPGIDLNAQDVRGRTPLHLAAENGQTEVVKIIITTEGINPYVKDIYGKTALDMATP